MNLAELGAINQKKAEMILKGEKGNEIADKLSNEAVKNGKEALVLNNAINDPKKKVLNNMSKSQ